MTHADAFLRDILAHPDDDAPRLIFADWLEEQGGANSIARAEFIRVQCALAAGKLPEQQRVELVLHEQQLLYEWDKVWVDPIRQLACEWHFHRGFIDDVAMLPDTFFAHADQLFSRAPIQRLTLRPYSPPLSGFMAVLADNEHLRCLRSLNLSYHGLESQDMRVLVVSDHLTGLTSLNLSHNRIGDSGIRALAGSQLLGRLEHLNLRGNDIGATGLRALAHALEVLADSLEGFRLQWLELYLPNLSFASQGVIAASPVLQRLVRRRGK